MVDMQTKTMDLPVRLTHDEVFARGQRLAAMKDEHTAALTELDNAASAWKETKNRLEKRQQGLEFDMRLLARAIGSQSELRMVEVQDEPDYKLGVMNTVRLDTGELVSSRGLSEAERQRSLFKPEKGKGAKAAGE